MVQTRAILDAGRDYIGTPYGLPPGPGELDCSSFILASCSDAGAPLPAGVRTAEQIRQATVPIGFAEVGPGDLLFFEHTYEPSEAPGPDGITASHVGISLGSGTLRMLDANERHGVDYTAIGTAYWQDRIVEARRVPLPAASRPTELPLGVDVSSWQGHIDWQRAAADGVQFALIKATEGEGYVNPYLATDWINAKEAGILRGAYHYARPDQGPPERQADHLLDAVRQASGLRSGDLLALDIETGTGGLADWTLAFVERIEGQVGFKPLVYTSPSFAREHGFRTRPELGQYGLWLADWQDSIPPAVEPWELVAIWQQTDSGRVDGINGPVDLDRFNGPIERLPLYGYHGGQ